MADKEDIFNISCRICCNSSELRRCSRCKTVYYCSIEHQKQDWKVHKKNCNVRSGNQVPKEQESPKSDPDRQHIKTQPVVTSDTNKTLSSGSTVDSRKSNESSNTLAAGDSENSVTTNTTTTNTTVPDEQCKHKQVDSNPEYEPVKQKSETEPQKASDNDTDGEPFEKILFKPQHFPKPRTQDFHGLSEFASKRLLKDGYCVIDDVLTPAECEAVLKEIKGLNKDGHLTSGKLAGGRTSGKADEMKVNKGIRSDNIRWIDMDEEEVYPEICKLVSESMDPIIGGMNEHLEEQISGRTKAMAACYPGGGSAYHKHVDNPRKDGRLITCILYLNKDWDVEKSGGFLRIYPSSLPEGEFVDVAPVMNRMLVFWSDRRNPHAVFPSYDSRYAVTVWYFDQEERMAAKSEQAENEAAQLKEEIRKMDIARKQLEKHVLEQQIENECHKVLNSLDPKELEAIYNMMAIHPSPKELLQQLGLAPSLQNALMERFKQLHK